MAGMLRLQQLVQGQVCIGCQAGQLIALGPSCVRPGQRLRRGCESELFARMGLGQCWHTVPGNLRVQAGEQLGQEQGLHRLLGLPARCLRPELHLSWPASAQGAIQSLTGHILSLGVT